MKYTYTVRRGYILFLTICMIAMMTLVVTQIFNIGNSYNSYAPIIFEKERAQQLALSGISIATAQLLLQDTALTPEHKSEENQDIEKQKKSEDQKKSEKTVSSQDKEQQKKKLLTTLLLYQNQWQEFVLTTAKDGIDGSIKICITCEDGKINLNELYNYQKKNFYSVTSSITTESLCTLLFRRMKEFFKDVDTEHALFTVLKKQKQPYISPFDLLIYPSLSFFNNYAVYIPRASSNQVVDEKEKNIASIFLQDIFTTYTTTFYCDPWVLSQSLRNIFGFATDKKMKQEDITAMLEKISLSSYEWGKIWDSTLKEIYGKEFKSLDKEFISFFSTKFEPRIFSVLCYGKVGRIEQKLLAIIELSTTDKGDMVTVKNIYWL